MDAIRKNVPNILSGLRILLAIILMVIKPFSVMFWIIYAICGVSDMIDGYIARKTNSTSKLGALLDSIGDMLFISVMIIILLPILTIPTGLMVWIAFIAFVRIVSLVIVYCKYHVFAILHTYANKLVGLLLFIFPFLYNFIDISIIETIICITASISAMEELVIHITSDSLIRDIKGIYLVYKCKK